MSKSRNKKGFTIIEVVLVLAIAGLIFLMVFIALPALQRGQRNTQRKNDLSRFVKAVTQYQANNSGKLPFDSKGYYLEKGDGSQFIERYIIANGDDSQFQDPDGEDYRFWLGNKLAPSDSETDKLRAAWNGERHYNFGEGPSFSDGAGSDIYVYVKAKCSDEEGFIEKSSGKNDFALVLVLEGNSFACADNQ